MHFNFNNQVRLQQSNTGLNVEISHQPFIDLLNLASITPSDPSTVLKSLVLPPSLKAKMSRIFNALNVLKYLEYEQIKSTRGAKSQYYNSITTLGIRKLLVRPIDSSQRAMKGLAKDVEALCLVELHQH